MDIRISQVICGLRRKYEITQAELGSKLGVSNNTVSKWEIGKLLPDAETLISLSEMFNVTMDELFGIGNLDNKLSDDLVNGIMDVGNIKGKWVISMLFLLACAIMLITNIIVLRYLFYIGLINLCVITLMLVFYFFKCYLYIIRKRRRLRPKIEDDE